MKFNVWPNQFRNQGRPYSRSNTRRVYLRSPNSVFMNCPVGLLLSKRMQVEVATGLEVFRYLWIKNFHPPICLGQSLTDGSSVTVTRCFIV